MELSKLLNILTPDSFSGTNKSELEQIAQAAQNHTDSRILHLSTIARIMQISAQDAVHGSIGGFDFNDVTMLGFFFEQELNALSNINQIKEDAEFNLHKMQSRGRAK